MARNISQTMWLPITLAFVLWAADSVTWISEIVSAFKCNVSKLQQCGKAAEVNQVNNKPS